MAIRRRRGISYTDSFSSLWSWLLGLALLGGVGYGVFYAIGQVNKTAKRHIDGTPELLDKRVGAKPKITPKSDGPRPGPSTPPPRKDILDRAAGDVNAAVLAKEAARFRGDTRLQNEFLAQANDARRRLEELRPGSELQHLEPGDEVLQFQDTDLTKLSTAAAGEFLSKAAESIPQGSYYKVLARRHGRPIDLYLYFPYATGAAGVATAADGRVKIDAEFAHELQQQVLSLGSDRLYPDDRRRVEKILGEGSASREDYAFLVRLLAKDAAGDAFNEKESFDQQIAKLEKMAATAPVPDALLTKTQHRVVGQIAAETQSSVTIQTVLMPLTIAKSDVQVFYLSKDLREEFDRRLKTAQRQPEAFPQLLVWCRDWQLPVHKELVAYHMLRVDRHDRQARLAANFFSVGEGKWSTRGNIASGSPVPAPPKPETRADVRPLLESYGFVEQGGRWFTRESWEAGIDTLHQPGSFPLKLQGLAVTPWREDDTPQSRDPSLKGRKTSNDAPRLRFLAPTATQGIATLSVEAPHTLVDCQLRAVGVVIEAGHGGRVEVFLTPEGSSSKTLYTIDQGGNDAWHDITPHVAGKKRFTVSARLSTTKDSYHAYARFLNSLPESKQVFWARGTVLKPSPDADRVWLGARP